MDIYIYTYNIHQKCVFNSDNPKCFVNFQQNIPVCCCLNLLVKHTHFDTCIHKRLYVSSSKEERVCWAPADTEKGEAVNIHAGAVSMPRLSAGSCRSIDLSHMTFTSNDRPASPQSCGKRCPFSFLLDVGTSRRRGHADHPFYPGLLHPPHHYMHIGGCKTLSDCDIQELFAQVQK